MLRQKTLYLLFHNKYIARHNVKAREISGANLIGAPALK